MISLLITLLVFALIAWAIVYILGIIGLPEPARKIAQVIVAVILLLWLLQILMGGLPVNNFHLR